MIFRALIISFACLVIARGAAPSPEEERDQVRLAALRFMMTKHAEFGSEREYYFLYVLRDIGYVKYFAAFRPAVVPFEEARFPTSSGRAVDAKTGKPVKIWSVGGVKIEGSKATVGISWYSASLAAGLHTVFLEKKDGVWLAISERTDGLSKKGPNQAPEPTPGLRPVVAHLKRSAKACVSSPLSSLLR